MNNQSNYDDNYPCTDHACYDRGNYHSTCSQCPSFKQQRVNAIIPEVPKVFQPKLEETVNNLIKYRLSGKLHFTSLYLIGSLARGTEITCNSDIDLLLTYDSHPSMEEHSNAYDFIEEITHPNVDIVLRSESIIQTSDSAFSTFVRRDRKLIWRFNFNGKI